MFNRALLTKTLIIYCSPRVSHARLAAQRAPNHSLVGKLARAEEPAPLLAGTQQRVPYRVAAVPF